MYLCGKERQSLSISVQHRYADLEYNHLFRVAFQDLIGILYFFDASWIAKQTSFNTDSTFMYCLQFLVNLRITLFTDSVALVV
jgi:hypothetical protein